MQATRSRTPGWVVPGHGICPPHCCPAQVGRMGGGCPGPGCRWEWGEAARRTLAGCPPPASAPRARPPRAGRGCSRAGGEPGQPLHPCSPHPGPCTTPPRGRPWKPHRKTRLSISRAHSRSPPRQNETERSRPMGKLRQRAVHTDGGAGSAHCPSPSPLPGSPARPSAGSRLCPQPPSRRRSPAVPRPLDAICAAFKASAPGRRVSLLCPWDSQIGGSVSRHHPDRARHAGGARESPLSGRTSRPKRWVFPHRPRSPSGAREHTAVVSTGQARHSTACPNSAPAPGPVEGAQMPPGPQARGRPPPPHRRAQQTAGPGPGRQNRLRGTQGVTWQSQKSHLSLLRQQLDRPQVTGTLSA